jgi:hypothetical protein
LIGACVCGTNRGGCHAWGSYNFPARYPGGYRAQEETLKEKREQVLQQPNRFTSKTLNPTELDTDVQVGWVSLRALPGACSSRTRTVRTPAERAHAFPHPAAPLRAPQPCAPLRTSLTRETPSCLTAVTGALQRRRRARLTRIDPRRCSPRPRSRRAPSAPPSLPPNTCASRCGNNSRHRPCRPGGSSSARQAFAERSAAAAATARETARTATPESSPSALRSTLLVHVRSPVRYSPRYDRPASCGQPIDEYTYELGFGRAHLSAQTIPYVRICLHISPNRPHLTRVPLRVTGERGLASGVPGRKFLDDVNSARTFCF